jgi:nitrate/nitrite transporter NarK
MLLHQASAMTRTFGLSGLFARPLGGILSGECSPGSAFWGRGTPLLSEAFFLPNLGTTSDERPVQSATTVLSIFSVVCELG